MELPRSTNVLIVGAGPTGLAASLSLIHHEFRDFVIVDAAVKGENSSRAIVVHAATLEVSARSAIENGASPLIPPINVMAGPRRDRLRRRVGFQRHKGGQDEIRHQSVGTGPHPV